MQCGLVGSYDPWNRDADPWDGQPGLDPSPVPEPDLQLLYQTHPNYVQRVARAALQSVQDGYLRPTDAARWLSTRHTRLFHRKITMTQTKPDRQREVT